VFRNPRFSLFLSYETERVYWCGILIKLCIWAASVIRLWHVELYKCFVMTDLLIYLFIYLLWVIDRLIDWLIDWACVQSVVPLVIGRRLACSRVTRVRQAVIGTSPGRRPVWSALLTAHTHCRTPQPSAPHTASVSAHWHCRTFSLIRLSRVCSLQCFDTVGWAAGRASGL